MMKQIFLSLLLALLPLVVSADVVEIDGIYYNLVPKAKVAEVTRNSSTGTVDIPKTVTYNNVTYDVTSIGNQAFYGCEGITSVTIPNSVTSIGSNAFSGCINLTSLTIPNFVTSIGSNAFAWCSSLTSLSIGNSVESIGIGAFQGCESLTSVTIPNSVESIGDEAFYWCTSLTSVSIGNSVLSIGGGAFTDCDKLEDVYSYSENVPITNAKAFNGSYIQRVTLHVPGSSIEAYKSTAPWSGFKDFVALPQFTLTYMVDGEVYKTYKYEEYREIPVEEAPTKVGYTFSGWSEIPETMPDHDVEVTGTFIVNKYNLIYMVDDEEYKTVEIEYGAEITPEAAPEKEGYTFSGWSEIPEIMPAYNVTITGLFEKIILGKCATPNITFKDGKFKFESEEEDVEFVWSFNIVNSIGKGSETDTPTKFVVSVYATKEYYEDSDPATMEMDMRSPIGDVNGDGKVDAADIAKLVGLVIGATPSSDNAPEGAMAIDLGLPSGTKWANMNVGATAQNEYGLFFAWGETVGYSSDTNDGRLFGWASYKWMTEGESTEYGINKYQIEDNQTEGCWYDTNYKFIGDGITELTPEDDAAHVNWGGDWYMPTIADIEELIDNTTSEWTTLKGVYGRKFTSKKNGNAIFLPAAGYRRSSSLYSQGELGYYWSSTLFTEDSFHARKLNFYSGGLDTGGNNRFYGRSVRPVLRK